MLNQALDELLAVIDRVSSEIRATTEVFRANAGTA
jgi:hypothetical protein